MVKAYTMGTAKYCPHMNEEPFHTLRANGADPRLLELHCRMEAPDAAAEVGNTNGLDVLDGVATPIHIFVISSDAADAAAGTGMRTVSVWGINADDAYVTDTITLTGAVQAEGAVLFKRVITAWGATFGTGKVAAGNISISNTGQAATYLYIAAGTNQSNRMRFWVADGYKASLVSIFADYYQAEAAAAVVLAAGSNLWTITCGSDEIPDTRADVPSHTIAPLTSPNIHPHHHVITGSDESYLALYHSSINTGANASHCIAALICIWQDPTPTGRNL